MSQNQPGYGQQQPPGYGQQPAGYGQQPPVATQAPAYGGSGGGPYGEIPKNPGKAVGIWGFVLAFFGPLAIIGLICSIVGLRKSKKSGFSNGLAIAGIIISILAIIGTVIAGFTTAGVIHILQVCNDLGPGIHQQGGVTYNCPS